MKTFLKIALGFVLGVVCTVGILFIIGTLQNLEQSFDELDINENEQRNIQSFELTTKNGIVKLHTYISKDSVQILMGRPRSTDINDYGYGEVKETWKYKGTNKYVDEFTIEFINGKLKSVYQFKDN